MIREASAALRRAPSPQTLVRIGLAAVIAETGIVVTGGIVRLSQSGLGCPTWPQCSKQSLLPGTDNPHPGLNQAIEYGNRSLAAVVMAVGVICVVAAYRSQRRELVRLAWLQPVGVLAQIVLGGITVLVKLNPAAVSSHFMLSMVILIATWAFYARTKDGDGPPLPTVMPQVALLTRVLSGIVFLLLIAGTIVTGTGPHAGDRKSPRFGFHITTVTQLHADLVWLVIGLTAALWAAAAASSAPERITRHVRSLLVIELAQGIIGYTQYWLHVPSVLVGFHIFGACLVWLATLRVLFELSTHQVTVESRSTIAAASLSTAPSA